MASPRHQVVVTGAGAVCAVGNDCGQVVEAVRSGRSGIEAIRRFDTQDFDVHLGAEVKAWDVYTEGSPTATLEERLCSGFARRAAGEALSQAAIHETEPHRCGIVFGTNLGDLGRPVHELATELGRELGFEGPMLTVCTACSSSTGAIGIARDLLLAGSVDVVVAGGSDVLTPKVFSGFHALGVLSPEPCAPFSTPFGTTLGEGAGFVVMETLERASRRGAGVLAAVSGYGLSGDGYHETSPDPRGRGVTRAIRSAIDDAGLTAAEIGYVNAHGSGTQSNDPSEWAGIQRGLEPSNGVWVSSSKGALGHAQGAAGVLEAIVTIQMMRRGLAPPTLNFSGARHYAPDDPVAGPMPRRHRYEHAICLNSAFGGANAAVVISRSPVVTVRERAKRSVHVLGLGLVTRFGIGRGAWVRREVDQSDGRVAPFAMRDVNPRIDPHGLDPSSRYLTAAASLALDDGQIRITRETRDRAGLVLGAVRSSPGSLRSFSDSIETQGLAKVSAPAFARIVLNAPAGFCSKLLDLGGPLTAVTVGEGSGLAGILLAANLLSTRPDVDLMLGAAVDELDDQEDGTETAGEGAVCVALGGQPTGDSGPHVVSWGTAGPGRVRSAIARALSESNAPPSEPCAVFDETDHAGVSAGAWALPSGLAFAAAVEALRQGHVERALVTSSSGTAMTAAMLLEG